MCDEGARGIVWLQDGEEEPFEPAPPPRRWLEESLEWSSGERDEEEPGDGAPEGERGASTLTWL